MEQARCAFFVGANSGEGFVSLMEGLRGERGIERCCPIKSGPGCGKSTALGRLGDALGNGGRREDLYCSSDPRSLDGVVLHGRGLALLDGTVPHVFEPDFPGADGEYLALPPLRDTAALRAQRPALLALKALSGQYYAAAYRALHAAALMEESARQVLLPLYPMARLVRRAESLARRELPATGGAGVLRRRFLDGLTPEGPLFLRESVEALCPRVIVLEDRYGMALPLLRVLRERALAAGEEVYDCLSPLDPARTLHLLLPGRGLAFVSGDDARLRGWTPEGGFARRLRLDAAPRAEELRAVRGRVRALWRLRGELLREGCDNLAAAHRLHDRIEEIYRPHVDFDACDRAVGELAARLAAQ